MLERERKSVVSDEGGTDLGLVLMDANGYMRR